MSFTDIDQAILISQDMLNQSFSQEQFPEQLPESQEQYPQFSQTQNSNILLELVNTPSQTKPITRNTIIPQAAGLFQYLIENQAKLYDIFQNFLHRLFQFHFVKKTLAENVVQNYIELQSVRRKLNYVQSVYNQTFQAFKNCIQYYQEKVLIMTSEIDKEDPYSLLTQYEIDLRRAIHDYYSFIDCDDPFASSKGLMTGSGNLSQYKNNLLDLYNPEELNTLERMAAFILNSQELEQINITVQQLLDDQISHNLLKVTEQLLQIWQFLFRFLNQYDISIIQFNFEIDATDLNSALVAAQGVLLIPQDIYQKIIKQNTKELLKYTLNTSGLQPLKIEYEKVRSEKNQKNLQTFLHFDKFDNLLKIADDALTNENENFSFSNAEHSCNEELSDYQQTLQKQRKYQFKSEQYQQTILEQAFELSFKGKITEAHLTDLQPPKHRSYIAEVGQMWKRVTPIVITRINCSEPVVNLDHLDYFSQLAYLHLFKPYSKKLFLWELETENVKALQCDIDAEFTNQIQSFANTQGHLFIFNPFSNKADNQFYKLNFESMQFQQLPNLKQKRKNFKVVQQNQYIYVIGGEDENGKVLDSCERFSMQKIEWQPIKSMATPLTKTNVVLFKNRFIIRFGGLNRFSHFDKTVERYDTKRHKWQILRQECDVDLDFKIQSICLQINENGILIFGGKNHNGFSDQSVYQMTIVGDKDSAIAKTQKLKMNQTMLDFIGEFDENIYYQNERLYFFRKEYSSLN